MNTTPSFRPRLVCRAARLWKAVAGGGAHHVEICAECRAYFASVTALESTLRRDASAWSAVAIPAPSAGFEQRLLHLTRVSAVPARPAVSRGWWLATLATTTTAVIACGLFLPPRGASERATQADAVLLAAALAKASRGFVETAIPSTGALVADNPLQREFTAIRTDARSALSFLALNFLPSSGAADASAVSARPL